jgi:hypothetical protein
MKICECSPAKDPISRQFSQSGYLIVHPAKDTAGLPLIEEFHLTSWEAVERTRSILSAYSQATYPRGLIVVPCKVFFDMPSIVDEPREEKADERLVVLPLFEWGGDKYPVIAELNHGFKLVAHKNCPAITNGNRFSTLNQYDDDPDELKDVKREAYDKLQEFMWRHICPMLNCPTYTSPCKTPFSDSPNH